METLCNWRKYFEDSLKIWEYFQNVISIENYDQNDDVFIRNGLKFFFLIFQIK
jgi:hypothetical protein